MILAILYFMPSLLCMMWVAIYMTKKKNKTQRLVQIMMALCVVHYAAIALFILPKTNYWVMCYIDLIEEPLLLFLLTLLLKYVLLHHNKKGLSESIKMFMYMPSLLYAPLLFAMYYLFGFENAILCFQMNDRFQVHVFTEEMMNMLPSSVDRIEFSVFELVDVIIFDILVAIYTLVIIAASARISIKHGYKFGDVYRFWIKGAKIPFVRAAGFCSVFIVVSALPVLILGRSYLVNHPQVGVIICLLTTISIFFFSYIETLSDEKHLTLKMCVSRTFAAPNGGDVEIKIKENKHEEKVTLAALRMKSLAEKIRVAFEEKKIFNDPDLTLASLAAELNVNRTTLSNTINQQYGLSFRKMLSNYRIKEAKEYILDNPKASQAEIANACGFKSASSFSHKFKELTGTTPNGWLRESVYSETNQE